MSPTRGARAAFAACLLVGHAAAEWSGILGLPFKSDKQVEQRAMHCHSGYITGLQVRRGRNSKDDTDFYDFKLKCGSRWGPWSGMAYEEQNHKEEKSFECPMKMHMTGLEVKQGRKELGDVDSYDFKLQCSGVWQSYLGLSFSNEKAKAATECPAGMMAYGWRAYRGFVRRGDQDFYEFELNCKEAGMAGAEAVRKAPTLREIGLPQNVFVWSAKDVGTWLKALGLGEYAPAFEMNKLQGDVIFLLLESHLVDMGMHKIGDRLYFMEVLTQLHDATNAWSRAIGQQLTSTRTLPNLHRAGLPLEVVSWSSKEVASFVRALGLGEWQELFMKHRVQGDVMFSLKEDTLAEMGVSRIGDRLYLVDCLQSLYEELTAWKKTKDEKIRAAVPALGGPGGSADSSYQAAAAAAMLQAQQQQARANAQAAGGGFGGRKPTAALQKLIAQGYSMQEIMQLLKARPELLPKFFQ
ncbi:hypothetical protein AB1Y20_022936 [Prymnesium parvum]|uniref:SAM domain-containing protein n=1 Tax=Prymnesium parvum TaxID=97485 RepID=A0AB34JF68_PRYPA|mmetsp:Transcript_22653/g.48059  ORF Transcript_22653/g.48059 Transcript_22653/m.48059 type:complete len:466 (-) Transcript_22653:363-1760(-)